MYNYASIILHNNFQILSLPLLNLPTVFQKIQGWTGKAGSRCLPVPVMWIKYSLFLYIYPFRKINAPLQAVFPERGGTEDVPEHEAPRKFPP